MRSLLPVFSASPLFRWQSACQPGQWAAFGPKGPSALPDPIRRWLAVLAMSGAEIRGWVSENSSWCVRSSIFLPCAGCPPGWSVAGLAWDDGLLFHIVAQCDEAHLEGDFYRPTSWWMMRLGISRLRIFSYDDGTAMSVYVWRGKIAKVVWHADTNEKVVYTKGTILRKEDGGWKTIPLRKWVHGFLALHGALSHSIEGGA